ncbi:MAG: hypothetical protein IKG93_06755 [Clostridiales bacterium]|nr:hypothetical protein [Clostridiales bacterium]
MAKTCFYCGRELAAGERCNCRGTANHVPEADASSAAASSASAATGTNPNQGKHEEQPNQKAKGKKEPKTKQVWNQSTGGQRFTFSAFITKARSIFPSFSKLLRPILAYVWHPVTTIQNRPQVVPVLKMIIVNSLFALLTSSMVVFTSHTDSPFLGMLISLVFGRTDLIAKHPFFSLLVFTVILWVCVLILAGCFTLTSRLVNRKLTFLRALDTVSMSSIYLCFADIMIFISVLLGSRGAFTLIFVAFVVMGIAHFVSLKQDLALSDNATFNMLAVSYLEFYFLAQLAVNVLLRILVLFQN